MPHRVGVTDKDGKVRFDNLRPGVYTFSVESEGYEPVEKLLEIKSEKDEAAVAMTLKPITKGFLNLQSSRLRGLVRSASSIPQVGQFVRESEHLIKLAPAQLKKDAARQFERVSRLAMKRIDDLRKRESSTLVGIGPSGLKVSRTVKKQ